MQYPKNSEYEYISALIDDDYLNARYKTDDSATILMLIRRRWYREDLLYRLYIDTQIKLKK